MLFFDLGVRILHPNTVPGEVYFSAPSGDGIDEVIDGF